MNKIYVGQCEHLENCCISDDACLKRYLHILNPKTGEVDVLVFCNDYLKLKIQDVDKGEYWLYSDKRYAVLLIQKEIDRHLKLAGLALHQNDRRLSHYSDSITKYAICFEVSNRPFAYVDLTFKTLVGWYYESPSNYLLEFIRKELVDFLDKTTTLKSKSKHKALITLTNKLSSRKGLTLAQRESILLEIINELFIITSKN